MRSQLLAAVAVLLPAAAFAGGYAVPNTNPRDLAMAGSLVAGQNSAEAVFVNPASLAGMSGLSVASGVSLIDFRSRWSSPAGAAAGETTMTPKAAFPFTGFISYSTKLMNHGVGIGFGSNVPGGGLVYWPGNWPGRFDIVSVDRRVYGLYLTGGVEIIPQIKLGGGLVYYRSTEHLSQAINFGGTEGAGEITTAGGKASYDISAEITPFLDIPLTFGFDYKHKGDQVLKGHARFLDVPAALRPNLLDQNATHGLTFPNVFAGGVAYRPMPELLLTGSFTLDRFTVYRQDLFSGDLGTNVVVNRDFHNGYTYRIGGEYKVNPKLTLRAGLLRDIAPSPSETLAASLPDANSWGGSLGVGYEFFPGLQTSLTYFRAQMDRAVADGTDNLNGSYSTRANIISLGLSYTPGAGSKSTGLSAANFSYDK